MAENATNYKSAMDMTDEEYKTALKSHAWRQPRTSREPGPTPKPAMGMTDQEFNAAMKSHAWREK